MLFGYDQNKQLVTQKHTFNNYFYIPEQNISELIENKRLSIDTKNPHLPYDHNLTGKKVYKCTINNHKSYFIPNEWRELSYQHDISPETKYLLDNKLQFSEHRHIIYYDIETMFDAEYPENNKPHIAKSPITSIVLYSNIQQNYYIFSWHPTETAEIENVEIKEDGNKIYFLCNNEHSLLTSFLEVMKALKADIITGWYSHGYDLPYIIKRLQKVCGDANGLSPTNNLWMGQKVKTINGARNIYYNIRIDGLDTVDMMQLSKMMSWNLQNNKLQTAAAQLLGPDFAKMKEVTWRDWQQNYAGFLEYAVRDVQILMQIDKKYNLIDYVVQMQILSYMTKMQNIASVTQMIDSYLIKRFWNEYVFPNQQWSRSKGSFKGAYVMDPLIPGVHRNVAILDFASLYPTTIMAYNISPETFLFSYRQCQEQGLDFNEVLQDLDKRGIKYVDTGYDEDLYGKRYIFLSQAEKPGIIPTVQRELYTMRKKYKKMLKNATTKQEKIVLDKKQLAMKNMLNSMYGALGAEFFRLYMIQGADAVTYFGRKSVLFAKDKMDTKYCYTTNYSDTDSCHVLLGKENIDNLHKNLEEFNILLKEELVKKHNPHLPDEYFLYDFEHEKTMDFMYYGDAKKRYYGIEDNGQKYIHGLNIIRKDTPWEIKDILNMLSQLSVREELTYEHLEMVFDKLKQLSYEDIGIHKAIKKDLDEYNKTVPQHVVATKFANEYFDLKISNTDPVYLFYIISLCENQKKPKSRHISICLKKDQFNLIKQTDKFILDYNELMQKQVIQPLRQFDKIELVKNIIDQWAQKHQICYRKKKDGQWIYKKQFTINSPIRTPKAEIPEKIIKRKNKRTKMNEELQLFAQYQMHLTRVADDGLQFSSSSPYKKFKVFYHPQLNEIVYIKEIGFDENLHLPILDFESEKHFNFNSEEQMRNILKQISEYL